MLEGALATTPMQEGLEKGRRKGGSYIRAKSGQ